MNLYNNNKIIIILLISAILVIDAFFIWRYIVNPSYNSVKSQKDPQGDERIDIDDEILPIISNNEKNIDWDSEERESRFNTLDFQIIKYYACKARKDESYYKEAKDYVNNFEHIDSDLKKTYLDYIDRNKNNIYTTHYTSLIVQGEYEEICGEDKILENSCRSGQIVLDDRSETKCRELCQYIKVVTNDKEAFEEGIMQPKWFYNFSNDEVPRYSEMDVSKLYSSLGVWRYSIAYRIEGESAINRLCQIWFGDNEELVDDFKRCNERHQRFLDITVNKNKSNCDFYLERAQETIDMQLIKQ